jgi:indole-3-glycerol phosphate synthase
VSVQRRLSQAISEGDGISVIVEVDGPDAARTAEDQGADGVLVYSGHESRLAAIRESTKLPVLFFWDGEQVDRLTGVDACIVDAERPDREWLKHVHLSLGDDFELALRIADDEHLAEVLEEFDPEILILAAPRADGEEALEHILDLLPDVPAGKLAIAEAAVTTREEVVALERAGIDAVMVSAGDVRELVGGPPPEV